MHEVHHCVCFLITLSLIIALAFIYMPTKSTIYKILTWVFGLVTLFIYLGTWN